MARQCALAGVSRSGLYYRGREESAETRELMRRLGLEAIYPRPGLTVAVPGHRIYPYRLRGMKIERPDQVWSSDITYIRLREGFIYLAAVMDWFSRGSAV